MKNHLLLALLVLLAVMAAVSDARKSRRPSNVTEEDLCFERLSRCQRMLDKREHKSPMDLLKEEKASGKRSGAGTHTAAEYLERAKGLASHVVEVLATAQHTLVDSSDDDDSVAITYCEKNGIAELFSKGSFEYRLRRSGETDTVCHNCACVVKAHERLQISPRKNFDLGVYRDGQTVFARVEEILTGSVDNYFFLFDTASGRVTHMEHDRLVTAPKLYGTSPRPGGKTVDELRGRIKENFEKMKANGEKMW